MAFYISAFNGALDLMTFEGSPVDVSGDSKQKILHSTLKFVDSVLMASDGQPGREINFGKGIYISVAIPDRNETVKIFNTLSSCGKVFKTDDKTFRGSKFGIGCMVSHEVQQEQGVYYKARDDI